ncbi:cellulose binding domain-containing protein [Roseomonas sp. 18066]|uniref:cellulose binding domain-containing protein n=1 Tax=Roseomonas sp. 18066 TaxID=2681412 RepID=UPI00135C4DDD|nr:cellulose binding domain-containing protein [Roseomonas sp. 18066]
MAPAWRWTMSPWSRPRTPATSVWGASVSRDAEGDLLFAALDYNAAVAAGGSTGFGFTASHANGVPVSFTASQFGFVSQADLVL